MGSPSASLGASVRCLKQPEGVAGGLLARLRPSSAAPLCPRRALSRTYRYMECPQSFLPAGGRSVSDRWRTRPASGGGTRERSRLRAVAGSHPGSPTSTPSTQVVAGTARWEWLQYQDTSRNTTLLFDRQEHIINSPRRRRRRSSPRSREQAHLWTHPNRPGPGSTGPWTPPARRPSATRRSPS